MALCLRGIAAHSPGNYGRNAMSVYRSRNSQETDGNLQSFVFLYRGGVTDFITDPSIDSGRRPRHNQKTKNITSTASDPTLPSLPTGMV